ncbi:6-phosphogluconolactonase [Echinicola sediminis]
MSPLNFYIGSYSEYPIPGFGGIGKGIYSVQLDTDNGQLKIVNSYSERNPSYLAINESNSHLYCITELDEGEQPKVKAFKIKPDKSLQFLNEQLIPGSFPCHIAVHQNQVLIACYMSGNIVHYPLEKTGALKKAHTIHQHLGSGINKNRQEGPHAHQVAVHPNHVEIYACDLGIDKIKAYRMKDEKLVPSPEQDCQVAKGGGPRHMVFHQSGNIAYVINELSGRVSILKRQKDVFKEIDSISSLPENFTGDPSGSAIRIHPNGQYLYVANRNLEAITLLKINELNLEVRDIYYTDGEEIREFNITPDGNWLIACHQNSHDTVVYKIEKDGTLKEYHRTKEILSPVCVVFPTTKSNL